MRITQERFEQVEAYFARHGGKTILVGRFIGLVRALAPFIAGSSGMRYRAFVPYSVLGTGLWAAAFCLLGYFLSQSIDKATEIAGKGALVFGIVVALIVGGIVIQRFLREQENRSQARARGSSRRRGCAGCCRRSGSPGGASRPAGSGSSSRRLIATLAVALFVLIGYAADRRPAMRGRRRATHRRSTSSTRCGATG